MKGTEAIDLFSKKCEELGGTPEVVDTPDFIPLISCSLSSLDRGKEMIKFINKLERPEDLKGTTLQVVVESGNGWLCYRRTSTYYSGEEREWSDLIIRGKNPGIPSSVFQDMIKPVVDGEVKKIKESMEKVFHSNIAWDFDSSFFIDLGSRVLEDEEVDSAINSVREIWDQIERSKERTERAGERTFLMI